MIDSPNNEEIEGIFPIIEHSGDLQESMGPEDPDNNVVRCLIANDECMQLLCLSEVFKHNGFEVTTAINGHEAFTIIQNSLEQNESCFDLVVLDLSMPISDGYDTMAKIQDLFEESLQKINGVSISFYKPYVIAASSHISDLIK